MEEIHEEVEEWVLDLGTTTGRAFVYERIIMVYWVMKILMAHVAMEGVSKR